LAAESATAAGRKTRINWKKRELDGFWQFANRLGGGAGGSVCENEAEGQRQVIENKGPEIGPKRLREEKFRKPPRRRAGLAVCEKPAPGAGLTGSIPVFFFNDLQKRSGNRVSQTFFVFVSPRAWRADR